MTQPENLMIDVDRTKQALAEVAATFATLAEEKAMIEAENIAALPEDKQISAKLFHQKQKDRISEHVQVVKSHLSHYVELLMIAELANTMPMPDNVQDAVKIISVMRIMAAKVMAPVAAHRENAAKNFKEEGNNPTKH